MANINEILQRAASLRDETALNSISPERAGGIMYDTLIALNELWLQQGSALVISKIYASVAAMEADTAPVSDLTGQPLRPGQIVVIASSDSDNGSVYRYNGTTSPSWTSVGKIGNLEPVDSLDSDSTSLPLAAHQGKVLDGKISQLGQQVIYDVSANNDGATFASLSALLSSENLSTLIPIAVRCGGMSIRFEQTSDNKYVQCHLKKNTFSTDAGDWLIDDLYVINVNYVNNVPTTAYQDAASARDAVPSGMRKDGLYITYLLSDGWHIEQYIGKLSQYDTWTSNTFWRALATKKELDDAITNTQRKFDNIAFISGKKILNAPVGIIIGDAASDSDWASVMVGCAVGDVFHIKGIGGSSYVLCSLCDKDKKVVRIASNSTTMTTLDVTVQSGECYAVFNVRSSQLANCYIHRDNIQNSLKDLYQKLDASNESLSGLQSRIENISFVSSRGIINATVGEPIAYLSNSDWASAMFGCAKGDVIHIKAKGGSSLKLCSTLDEGLKVVRVVSSATTLTEVDITIQEGERFVTVNTDSAQLSNSYIHREQVQNNIIDLYDKLRTKVENYKTYYIAASDSSDVDKAIADVICAGSADQNKINPYLKEAGATVILLAGTYTVSGYISITANNVHIIGRGDVIIMRNASANAIATGSAVSGSIVENIITDGAITLTLNSATIGEIINCTLEYGTSNQTLWRKVKVGTNNFEIHCGTGLDVDSFSMAMAYARQYPEKATVYVHGHHILTGLTEAFQFYNSVDIIGVGDDATLEVQADLPFNGFWICDGMNGAASQGITNYSTFRNIRFLRTGECNGYDFYAVYVTSSNVKFFDCVFQNDTSSPTAFSQPTDPVPGGINTYGDRRHGIEVTVDKFDDECKTEFHNCKGIGSPYGFKNSRGWYLYKGSPKLYNCIGIGGGIGKYGHGYVLHRHSKAYLYDCIGYGSPYGWQECNGFQFQACTASKLFNCIGFGSRGYQYVSTGGRANYTKQNTITAMSYGMWFWHIAAPQLVGCSAYAGDGENSMAMRFSYSSKPIIKGGVSGKDLRMFEKFYSNDSGQSYMTLMVGNDGRPIDLYSIYIESLGTIAYGTKILIKAGNDVIANAQIGTSGDTVLPITQARIASNVPLTISFTDASDNPITLANGVVDMTFRYKVANAMLCMSIEDSATPFVEGVTFDGNNECDGIQIANDEDYTIKDCTVLIPATKKAVLCPTSKSDIRIFGCAFTSQVLENVTSFDSETALLSSSNKVI